MSDQLDSKLEEETRAQLAHRVVVVIPVLNEVNHIEDCVKALMTGSVALANVQLIIVDGGSTDGTLDKVETFMELYPNLSILDNPKKIQAAAVNLGAQQAEEHRDILVRCDAHATYPENFILNVARGLERFQAESVVVPMDAIGHNGFQKANAWVVDTPLGSGGSSHRGGQSSGFVDHGHHAAFNRDFFLSLGGYDETFTHNEDAEYDARLHTAGGKVYLDATLRIGYFPRDTISGLWQQYFSYGEGRAKNLLKNCQQPKVRQLVPVLNVLALSASFVLLGLNQAFVLYPIFYTSVLVLMGLGLLVIKRSFIALYTPVALAVMHQAWGLGFLKSVFLHKRSSADD